MTINNIYVRTNMCNVCMVTNFLIGMSPESEQIAREMSFKKGGKMLNLQLCLMRNKCLTLSEG